MQFRMVLRIENDPMGQENGGEHLDSKGRQREVSATGKKDMSEMQMPANAVRCTLLNGSAWCTEEKYMRRYKGTFDVFFGIALRMRREEMKEQFNKESKQGWRFAAYVARITDESASSEDRKHTSGRVFVAINRNLVVDKGEGAVMSSPGNEG